MNDPHRVALYLRLLAGELAEAKGEVIDGMANDDTVDKLDSVSLQLRDLADRLEAADV